jgi:hypothetical protein
MSFTKKSGREDIRSDKSSPVMETFSTYGRFGIPEAIATALLLFWFSLSLAPWLGGTDVGTIKIPRLSARMNRWLRVVGRSDVFFLPAVF